jgi:hypothetical protein
MLTDNDEIDCTQRKTTQNESPEFIASLVFRYDYHLIHVFPAVLPWKHPSHYFRWFRFRFRFQSQSDERQDYVGLLTKSSIYVNSQTEILSVERYDLSRDYSCVVENLIDERCQVQRFTDHQLIKSKMSIKMIQMILEKNCRSDW